MIALSRPEDIARVAKMLWPDAMFDGRCTCPPKALELNAVCAECRADQRKIMNQDRLKCWHRRRRNNARFKQWRPCSGADPNGCSHWDSKPPNARP